MSYKCGQQKQVVRLSDLAVLPCTYDAGTIVAQDEYSPDVKTFRNWVSLGNVPAAADAPPLPDPRLVQDAQECDSCKADTNIMALVNQTRAEWRSWAGTNFPTLAVGEKTRLGDLFWVVAVGVRRIVRVA